MRKDFSFWGIVLGVLALDQGTKYLVSKNMVEGDSIPLIPNIFHLTYVLNPGAAFGMLAHRTPLFIIFSLVALGLVVFFYKKIVSQPFWIKLSLAFQLSGALGNLLDRVRTGYVVDFFDFKVWPVFNIADMAIVSGVIIFFWQIVFNPEANKGKNNESI